MILQEILNNKLVEIKSMPDFLNVEIPLSKRDFIGSLQKQHPAIVSELKSKSPSEGIICADYDVEEIAKKYEKGGASALSVLTDKKYFGGGFSDLKAASEAVSLPVMCKEFIISKKQIRQARLHGADACLLIVRVLSDDQLADLYDEVQKYNMDALVEVFDEKDISRALKISPSLVGINNRNLDSLVMDTSISKKLRKLLPSSTIVLSLSGAKTPEDIKNCPLDGVLAGTALMQASDPVRFLLDVRA